MTEEEMAKKAVEALDIVPGGDTRRRPVHTNGVGVEGHFVASEAARDYCVAEHFQGGKIKVTARFSNGSGKTALHDGWSDVRGLAVRFHLEQDKQEERAVDLLAMTLTEFFTPTYETFLKFASYTNPEAPVTRQSAWRKLLELLELIQPALPAPYPGQTTSSVAGALRYADEHARSELSIFHAAAIGAPKSYARAAYHAVHTFFAVAPDGTRRAVRFNWVPVSGVLNTGPEDPVVDDYLKSDLQLRIKGKLGIGTDPEPVRFILMMTIGETGDDFDDPSRSWPPHRTRIVMGTLTIDAVASDQDADGERLSFNPWRLVEGLEPSNDPILSLRRNAYEFSRKRRGGVAGCPFSGV